MICVLGVLVALSLLSAFLVLTACMAAGRADEQ